jgi:N utilization substance protein B
MSEEEASSTGGRHRGREVALQVLYAIDLAVADPDVDAAEESSGDPNTQIFDRVSENFVVPTPVVSFARELVAGVRAGIDELDEMLGTHARNWRVSRMAAVDRNVLRLAVYELRDTDTPVAVVIDEAVDLARRFGSESSPSFVNGVLDAVAREVRAA